MATSPADQIRIRAAADAGSGTVSSGTIVSEEQQANADFANIQRPETLPAGFVGQAPDNIPTNAEQFTINDDAGTDALSRLVTELQAVPPTTANSPIPNPDDLPAPGTVINNGDENVFDPRQDIQENVFAPYGEGVGAGNEDSAGSVNPTNPQGSNEITTLVNKTARAITPQSNILDNFSSYTYSVSLYLMSPEDYRRLMTTKQRYLAGYQLLMQSGGAPLASDIKNSDPYDLAPGEISLTQGRNQFFPLDYYIDDLQLTSLLSGKGTGGAHNITELRFKIIEPNGISLLDNLFKATKQYIESGGGASSTTVNNNYAAQNYLMVIRWYGYDSNGNMITGTGARDASGKSDLNSIVEKFIPFQFTGIKFRIANKLTEYECTAVCPQNVINTGQGRGVIPYNIELTGTTLQKLFNGNLAYTAPAVVAGQQDGRSQFDITTAPDKANTAPGPTLITGLTQALNKYQAELVTNGTYDIADRYKIVISHPELANASIVPPGSTDLKSKPMVVAASAAQEKDGVKQSVDKTAKTVSATAGMSIVQMLDLAVRSSDYIYKQQTKIIDKDGNEIPQKAANAFAWYKIGLQAKPIGKTQDPKRNDFAYEITYEIAPYGINDLKSEYFPKGKFRGAQKKYAYWFTGENTSVLNFEQDFNYLYYITVNSRQQQIIKKSGTSDYREIEKRVFSPNSPQSNQGIEGNINEPSANAADYLYSPADQARAKLTIIGDPAWIAQGEVWSGIRSTAKPLDDKTDVFFDAFLADGTINFDAREALFELVFNKPVDYNMQTGLMETTGAGTTSQVYVYKALTAVSNFRQGRFTQDLDGVLLIFPDNVVKTQAQVLSGITSESGDAAANTDTSQVDDLNGSATETARTQQQNNELDTNTRSITGAQSGITDSATDNGYNADYYGAAGDTTAVSYTPASPAEVLDETTPTDLFADGVAFTTQPGQTGAPTSYGEIIGGAGGFAAADNFDQNTVAITATTIQGTTVTITTPQQANLLYAQGILSNSERNRVVTDLNSYAAAQNPVLNLASQNIRKDD
jgi:hypothetical protein